MSDVQLRPATPHDAAAVTRVLIASRRAFLPYAPSVHTDDEVARWVREVLLVQSRTTVAVDGDEVVGVLAISESTDANWIDQMYLLPTHVGQGIGTRLLAHGIEGLRGVLRLHTFQQNTAARRFYERHGFVALAFGDGSGNEEGCPDVLYERL